jgi:hypothetical protein
MSTYLKALQNAADRPARAKPNGDESGKTNQPVVEKIDVTVLEIDETYELDCDPYNNTGQFLVDALKNKYDD